MGYELSVLVVIGTDSIGTCSCKSIRECAKGLLMLGYVCIIYEIPDDVKKSLKISKGGVMEASYRY